MFQKSIDNSTKDCTNAQKKQKPSSPTTTTAVGSEQSKEIRRLSEFNSSVDFNKSQCILRTTVIGITNWYEEPKQTQVAITVFLMDEMKSVFQLRTYAREKERFADKFEVNNLVEIKNVVAAIQSKETIINMKLDVVANHDTDITVLDTRWFELDDIQNRLKPNSLKTFSELPQLVQKDNSLLYVE